MTPKSRPFADRAAAYIRQYGLISPRDGILAAVSGGPDSVALLNVMIQIQEIFEISHISVAHFDHRLRGRDSDADREFVRDLAGRAGMQFYCGSGDVLAFSRANRISVEMAARQCRHSFLRRTAGEICATRIALGHTATDQAEEVLLRILRGTGPGGIRAMLPATADGIIRPLLFATREEILRYLEERGASFRNDLSNFEPFCQRNRLRLEVFPLLRSAFHPEIERTIARHAELAREEDSWWEAEVDRVWADLCREESSNGISLNANMLGGLHKGLLRRVLRHALERIRGDLSGIGMTHLEALVEAVRAEKRRKSIRFPGGFEAIREQESLLFRKIPAAVLSVDDTTVQVPGPGIYRIGNYQVEISIREGDAATLPRPGKDVAIMDSARLKWPLCLRFWHPGDRFHPLGMECSKKLQDFFTDAKIPKEARGAVPLLCDREKICWVAGLRMDERVRGRANAGEWVIARLRAE
ncbi:MAG: tRNA lysidine(34) synthetase TilS [Desulfobacteraceae bacterium]|nr:tRNA lysidine(34) synthetase TilS [Desulfobacteraceae bacterium]